MSQGANGVILDFAGKTWIKALDVAKRLQTEELRRREGVHANARQDHQEKPISVSRPLSTEAFRGRAKWLLKADALVKRSFDDGCVQTARRKAWMVMLSMNDSGRWTSISSALQRYCAHLEGLTSLAIPAAGYVVTLTSSFDEISSQGYVPRRQLCCMYRGTC